MSYASKSRAVNDAGKGTVGLVQIGLMFLFCYVVVSAAVVYGIFWVTRAVVRLIRRRRAAKRAIATTTRRTATPAASSVAPTARRVPPAAVPVPVPSRAKAAAPTVTVSAAERTPFERDVNGNVKLAGRRPKSKTSAR